MPALPYRLILRCELVFLSASSIPSIMPMGGHLRFRLTTRLPALAAMILRASTFAPTAHALSTACSASKSPLAYTLIAKERLSPDSSLLRFSLPPNHTRLGDDPTLPTCIKVVHPFATDASGAPALVEKSYSPVSHPAAEGELALVVKAYPPAPGGGVGAYLCSLEPGEQIRATVKKPRAVHGHAAVARRWASLGLVAGGTGIAPLLQVVRIVLADAADETRVRLLSVNRREEDCLMRAQLDALAAEHPERLQVAYSLTAPSEGWEGYTGRGDVEMIRKTLPPSTKDGRTMIFVCGTDGFVATWGGAVGRAPNKPDGSVGEKVQGPLMGLLADAGYDASEVFKY